MLGRSRHSLFPLLPSVLVSLLFFSLESSSNDLAVFNDEFGNSSTLSNWSRVNVTEGWNADQLETLSIDTVTAGQMMVMPYTCTWFEDYRGPMVYKNITGDVVVTASVEVSGRDGFSVPQTEFSLAGLMMRTPRAITPGTWTTGGENYVFFSIGHGNNGGSAFQYEVKTTIDSVSTLILSGSASNTAILQIARVGDYVIVLLKEPGQAWGVHRRYSRSDFPSTVQIGAVSYTNWEKASIFTPFVQNGNVLDPPLGVTDPNPGIAFNPDIIGTYDYIRFFRPTLPASLTGIDLTNTGLVTDADLLEFLAGSAVGGLTDPWVDFGFAGSEEGSQTSPFDTLAEAIAGAADSATVSIKGDTGSSVSNETMTINQAVTLVAVNGTVRIGGGARSSSEDRSSGFVSRD